jgi:hypothetical protein
VLTLGHAPVGSTLVSIDPSQGALLVAPPSPPTEDQIVADVDEKGLVELLGGA